MDRHTADDEHPTYRGKHLAGADYLPEIGVDPYHRTGLTPAETRYYEGKHVHVDDEYPTYVGRHRARHEDASRSGGRRAMVATTIATTLTAGGIVGALWHHSGGQPEERASRPRPVTKLADVRARVATLHALPATTVTRRTTARTAAFAHAITRAPAKPAAPRWVRPGTGVISSCFCARWGTFHWGVDLAAPYGAPIYAAGDGVVLRAGPATGFGQAVYIQHANGDTTVYGHMEKILVTVGERVRAGQQIALVGAEGEATGPHLHFEVHKGSEYGEKINPGPWLAARGVKL